jgi:hypothetical protein
MKDNDVIVVGSLNYDIVFKQERLRILEKHIPQMRLPFRVGKGANKLHNVQNSALTPIW